MLRSLFVDPIRLLTRWAVHRWGSQVIAFAILPTRREMRVIVRRCMGDGIASLVADEMAKAEHRTSLH